HDSESGGHSCNKMQPCQRRAKKNGRNNDLRISGLCADRSDNYCDRLFFWPRCRGQRVKS
ncbi:hypothetical protein NSP75_23335, partial [Salmonella enterica]|nr:hypothetical protein [Salmonella enterica]